MKSYYNEFSKFPADWIRNLIEAGIIPGGCVDERSISELQPEYLVGQNQCHFFAGVGGWSIALREAGWPDDIPVWTGSCPCQPFSAAGLGRGTADDRHLWPEFLRLITACRPPHIFGEQVSGRKVTGKLFTSRAWERLKPEDRRAAEEADSEAWFRHVQTDLERVGYIVGHCVFPACSVGSAHLRQRLYWYARYVGDTAGSGQGRGEAAAIQRDSSKRTGKQKRPEQAGELPWGSEGLGAADRLANPEAHGQGSFNRQSGESVRQEEQAGGYGVSGGMADMQRNEKYEEQQRPEETQGRRGADEPCGCSLDNRPGPTNGFWRTVDWIFCRDDKWRPVEPGSSPLAHGIPWRASKIRAGIQHLGLGAETTKSVLRESKAILKVARDSRNGQLSGYGNAIVIPQAVEFIRACMEEFDEQ